VLAVAQKALPGVPAKVLEGSLEQVDWAGQVLDGRRHLDTTTAFIDAIGALPDGAKVTTSDWTTSTCHDTAGEKAEGADDGDFHRHAREHDRGRGRDRTTRRNNDRWRDTATVVALRLAVIALCLVLWQVMSGPVIPDTRSASDRRVATPCETARLPPPGGTDIKVTSIEVAAGSPSA